ncbi:MAG: hypothetical protein MUP16_02265, partial [Sedimentisphaerales bacterium]|nr:hypothetical protein [Sedimentisphaerales bacterium]
MKTKLPPCLLTLAIVLFLSGSVSAEVSLEYLGTQRYVSFKITNEHLKEPLIITGKESDTIFYRTVYGCMYLMGEPFWTEKVEGGFHGRWRNNEGRIVDVLIKPEGNNFHIRFSAEPNLDIREWGFSLKASADEYFTGCFERTVDGEQKLSWKKGIKPALNLRGESVTMSIRPTLSLYCPFYLSSRGYGLFTEGTWPGFYDFCKSDKNLVKISFEGPLLELILYTSRSPMEIVSAHSLYVGPTILPPKWVFSCWRW